MNKLIKYISGSLMAGVLMFGFSSCSPDEVQAIDPNAIPNISEYADAFSVSVDQSTNIATFSFDASKAPGVYPITIIDGKQYSTAAVSTKYFRKAGDYSVEFKVANKNGISNGKITETFHINKTMMSGFGGFNPEFEHNLLRTCTANDPTFYYAPGWSKIADPIYSGSFKDGYTLKLPAATTDQWQCQMAIVTDVNLEAGKTYDGSVILTSSVDHPSVTWKICDPADGNTLFDNGCSTKLKAGEPLCVFFSEAICENGLNGVKLVFDFGGNAENTEITVENFVLKDHAFDDGTVLPEIPAEPEPKWAGLESEENLWFTCTKNEPTFYYANEDWSGRPAPKMTVGDHSWTLEFPQATAARWQNQFTFATDLTMTADDVIDFKVEIESNTSFKAMCKLVQANISDTEEGKRDKNYFFETEVELTADETTTFWVANAKLAQGDAHLINMVFDFGTNPAGTVVTVKNIIIQKHKN